MRTLHSETAGEVVLAVRKQSGGSTEAILSQIRTSEIASPLSIYAQINLIRVGLI